MSNTNISNPRNEETEKNNRLIFFVYTFQRADVAPMVQPRLPKVQETGFGIHEKYLYEIAQCAKKGRPA